MSNWTHVNASIRYDAENAKFENLISPKDLGIIQKYGSDIKTDFIPCDGYTSLDYHILDTGEDTPRIACRVVVVIGDLENYMNVEEVLAYFTKITTGKIIRSGLLEICTDRDVYCESNFYHYHRIDRTYRYVKNKWEHVETRHKFYK
jgi:hypothetical protein